MMYAHHIWATVQANVLLMTLLDHIVRVHMGVEGRGAEGGGGGGLEHLHFAVRAADTPSVKLICRKQKCCELASASKPDPPSH